MSFSVAIRTQMSTLKHNIRQQQAQLHNLENTLLRGPRPLPRDIFNSPPYTTDELDQLYPSSHASVTSSSSSHPTPTAKLLRRSSFEVLSSLAGPDSNLPLPRRDKRSSSFGEDDIREGIPTSTPSKRSGSPTRSINRMCISLASGLFNNL